ncbi:MAG: hypothetical protein EZS28_005346 [Streblomastix strix]|uniref:Uncharacterized protein n=1 Tax=Streblomastix strix TaxID=222440 RepID=A0A5J4WWE7_9EUKA|nr:MAG: hypothetical protein EZS28_005346 [Streblomastix strix]
MNLNPTIDLFSQHFNNLLPRFMSTTRGHGETAIDAFNQTWKKELPWIHPSIPLLPAVLKKIREELIEAMIIAPLWPGQIWYIELVNVKCSIPYAWLEQRNFGTRNIVNQEEFETPARKDMLFPDGPKARKGRRFARKILIKLNVSKGAIDMILY